MFVMFIVCGFCNSGCAVVARNGIPQRGQMVAADWRSTGPSRNDRPGAASSLRVYFSGRTVRTLRAVRQER